MGLREAIGERAVSGGWRRRKQTFSRTAAQTQAGMLVVTVAALVLPAVFRLVHGGGLPAVSGPRISFGHDLEQLSLGVALVLIATYIAGLLFSLRTHRDLFNPEQDDAGPPGWSLRRSVLTLVAAAMLVALASNTLVG